MPEAPAAAVMPLDPWVREYCTLKFLPIELVAEAFARCDLPAEPSLQSEIERVYDALANWPTWQGEAEILAWAMERSRTRFSFNMEFLRAPIRRARARLEERTIAVAS